MRWDNLIFNFVHRVIRRDDLFSHTIMARPIKNAKAGVAVKINPCNARKVIKIIKKTHRTFATEVNMGVEEYADKKIVQYRDDGR